jgi:hypothetical protein
MKKYLILLLLVTTFSCATIKISSDYDRQADFSKYKTYQLSNDTQNLPIQQLNRDRIIAAIENEMAAKGFSKSDNPDLIVDVNITGKEIQTATATTTGGYGYGYRRWGYSGGFSTTQINYDQYTEGTMIITFVDASVEKIVWQGTGTKTLVENASTEKREKNINYAVQQIINKYPPVK